MADSKNKMGAGAGIALVISMLVLGLGVLAGGYFMGKGIQYDVAAECSSGNAASFTQARATIANMWAKDSAVDCSNQAR